MSAVTKIQWCDSTVNPVMGCGGCESSPTQDLARNSVTVPQMEAKVRDKTLRH